jgi:hypothetical protein
MGIIEKAERVVAMLTVEDMIELRQCIDECLFAAIKFDETGKTEYFVKMKNSCQTFLQMLDELEKKADS